jgi:PilZ domain
VDQTVKNVWIFLSSDTPGARIAHTPLPIKRSHAGGSAGVEETMNSSERRHDTRVHIRVPLHFRLLESPGSADHAGESENISQRGIYFATNVPLKVGAPVEVSLQMPKELTGGAGSEVKCMARVVHIQPDSFLGGKAGIGMRIERYESVAAADERWAS